MLLYIQVYCFCINFAYHFFWVIKGDLSRFAGIHSFMAQAELLGLTSEKRKLDFNCLFSIIFEKVIKTIPSTCGAVKFPFPVLFLDLQYFEYDSLQKIIVFLKPPTGVHLIGVIQSKWGGLTALWKRSVTGKQSCLLPSPGHILSCVHVWDFLGLPGELWVSASRIQLPDIQKYVWTRCSGTTHWFYFSGRSQTSSQEH